MLRKIAIRFLFLAAASLLAPNPAGALDFTNGFPVGDWGNGVRPYVRVSAQDGRLSAIFSVVIIPGTGGSSRHSRQSEPREEAREGGGQASAVEFGP